MRAVVVDRFGGPEVLRLADVPVKEPGPGEVRIRMSHASINPADWKSREGFVHRFFGETAFPLVLGFDGAGVIEKVGEGSTAWKPGDRVMTNSDHGYGKWGTYAEQVVTRESNVGRAPKNWTLALAATIPIAGMTAWQDLFVYGGVKAGQSILVHGGSGGLGTFGIQFAKAKGIKVAATCSTANVAYVSSLGADKVIDYRTQDIVEALNAWRRGGVDAVLDNVGCGTLPQALDLLCRGGVLVSIATLVGDGDIEGDTKAAAARGLRKVFAVMTDVGARELMNDISALIETGAIQPPPIREFPLADVAEAQALVQEGHVRGKIVLKIADIE